MTKNIKTLPFHTTIVDALVALEPRESGADAKAAVLGMLLETTTIPPAHCQEVVDAIETRLSRLESMADSAMARAMARAFRTGMEAVQAQFDAHKGGQNGAGTATAGDVIAGAQTGDQERSGVETN